MVIAIKLLKKFSDLLLFLIFWDLFIYIFDLRWVLIKSIETRYLFTQLEINNFHSQFKYERFKFEMHPAGSGDWT